MAPTSHIYSIIHSLNVNSPDAELAQVIVAVQHDHADDENVVAALALALASSGVTLNSECDLTADIASTGGPSSLSTLLCPLFLRAANTIVPKLGVPGRPAGGIDCLAQIPGYRCSLSGKEVQEILKTGGYAHFVAEGELAPLDGRMFRIRQALGAQAVPALVAASLLAKKVAVGIKLAGLDVRVAPHGNFGTTWDSARRNSQLFCRSARLLGIRAFPVLTDARYPVQPFLGRKESLVALAAIFASSPSEWLVEHYRVCRSLSLACMPEASRALVASANPTLLRKHFEQNLSDQGAGIAAFEELVQRTRGDHRVKLSAERAGFCHYPLKELRDAIVACQKKFESSSSPFPDPVGLVFSERPGTWVNRGDPVATLRVSGEAGGDVIDVIRRLVCFPAASLEGLGLESIYE